MATAEPQGQSRDRAYLTGPMVLVVSPHAGQVAHSATPEEILRIAGVHVAEVVDVRALDLYQPLGKRWQAQGYIAAIAAGGDGTIGNVATQLVGSGIPLGILPLGTSNDVARSLGVPLNISAAATAITHAVPTLVDVGEVVLLETEKPTVQEPGGMRQSIKRGFNRLRGKHKQQATPEQTTVNFVHAATLGLNAAFARLATDVARRQRWGNLTYATAALEALLHIQPVPIKITFQGVPNAAVVLASASQSLLHTQNATPAMAAGDQRHSLEAQVVQLAAVNTPIFGGRMNFQLPLSHPSDQLLDFVIIEALEPTHLRESIGHLLTRLERMGDSLLRHPDASTEESYMIEVATSQMIPGVYHIQAQRARIETTEPVDVTLDGELGLRTPVEIRLAEQPLSVLLPQAAHDSLQQGQLPLKGFFGRQ